MNKLTILSSAIALAGGWQLAQAQPPGGGGGFAQMSFDALNTETEESPDHLTQAEVMAWMQERMAAFGRGGPGGARGAGAGGPGGADGPGGGMAGMFSRWDADGDGMVSREEFDARPRGGGRRGGGPGAGRGGGGQDGGEAPPE